MHLIKTLVAFTALATSVLTQSDYDVPVPFLLTLNISACNAADPRFAATTVFGSLYVTFFDGMPYFSLFLCNPKSNFK